MKLSRIKKLVFLHLQHLPMKSRGWRPTLCKWGGVNIKSPKKTFIGVRIVTHFMNPKTGSYDRGQVHVGKGAYIGMGTMVVKPVTIGEGAIVGAGAIVTKDIPSNEVWAGNPARFIRKR